MYPQEDTVSEMAALEARLLVLLGTVVELDACDPAWPDVRGEACVAVARAADEVAARPGAPVVLRVAPNDPPVAVARLVVAALRGLDRARSGVATGQLVDAW